MQQNAIARAVPKAHAAPAHAAILRKHQAHIARQAQQIDELVNAVNALQDGGGAHGPLSPEEEIDAIPGRRGVFNFTQTGTFTTTLGAQTALSWQISQDGPFVVTHYPVVAWYPTLPTNADNFQIYQTIVTGVLLPNRDTVIFPNPDYICLSYQWSDGGSQRNLETTGVPTPSVLLSTPDSFKAMAKPMMFAPAATIQLVPTLLAAKFNSSATHATTTGTYLWTMVGYRILNGA